MNISSSSAKVFALVLGLCIATAVQAQKVDPAAALPSLAPLIESAKRAVVNVDVQVSHPRLASMGSGEHDNDLFEHFFRQGRGRRMPPVMPSAGSGFIIDPRGLVLTNNHVVEHAVAIRVHLDDGRAYDADVLGRDPLTDVALIKLRGKVENLPVARLGDSNALRVGDWVVAIGNPFRLASSVSLGIVSARERNIRAGPYDEFIQTDAAINPGNSGGPLFNLQGEVVGINTAIIGGGAGGIGFAVPIHVAKALLPQLEKDGSVTRGWLGVGIQDLSGDLAKALGVPGGEGAVVTSVNDGSPAKKGGLREDDVILAVDGEKVSSGGALSRTVALKRPESTVSLSVLRGGKPMELKVKLGTRPDLENVGMRGRAPAAEERQQRVGLLFSDVDPRLARSDGLPPSGALITEVVPGSPAERADLMPGMVVIEADRKPVKSAADLARIVKASRPGDVVLLRVVGPQGTARSLRALRVP
ncbi:MAG: trypsin-like peptidase domain-containing protein [Myxococcota bacterium]